jgi:hypothetical protein
MFELATGAFLILHGLVHLSYLAPKVDDPHYPFVPERSWVATAAHLEVGTARSVFSALAVATAIAYAAAGVGLVLDAGWWPALAVAGSIGSLTVLLLGFHPWLVLGVAIDVGVIALALSGGWS